MSHIIFKHFGHEIPLQSVHMPLQAPESYIEPYRNISASKPREKYSGMVSVLGTFLFVVQHNAIDMGL